MSKYVGFRLGKVHESHVISEYYCGGCGWPVTDHDSFCPECGGAFRECDASDLESENAKLRELVADAWRLFTEHGAVHPSNLPDVDAVRDRMRELRVEVDGGTMARLRSVRTAPRVIVADGDTDCATGHCECGGCGGAIDCWDRFCRHCGARMEDAQ